jgi:hypothetical protein
MLTTVVPFGSSTWQLFYAAVGEADAALDVLQQLLSMPAPLSTISMESGPAYASLRDHPSYRILVKRYQ